MLIGIHTRESCYRIVDRISRVCPIVASADAELLVLLFRLLDCEVRNAYFAYLLCFDTFFSVNNLIICPFFALCI